jgi:hypothetical protein
VRDQVIKRRNIVIQKKNRRRSDSNSSDQLSKLGGSVIDLMRSMDSARSSSTRSFSGSDLIQRPGSSPQQLSPVRSTENSTSDIQDSARSRSSKSSGGGGDSTKLPSRKLSRVASDHLAETAAESELSARETKAAADALARSTEEDVSRQSMKALTAPSFDYGSSKGVVAVESVAAATTAPAPSSSAPSTPESIQTSTNVAENTNVVAKESVRTLTTVPPKEIVIVNPVLPPPTSLSAKPSPRVATKVVNEEYEDEFEAEVPANPSRSSSDLLKLKSASSSFDAASGRGPEKLTSSRSFDLDEGGPRLTGRSDPPSPSNISMSQSVCSLDSMTETVRYLREPLLQ